MDFTYSDEAKQLQEQVGAFVRDRVLPSEEIFNEQVAQGEAHAQPPILEELKQEARSKGLWNLFLPHETPWHKPLTNVDYAPLAELSGHSLPMGPETMNCSAPDTGNMELLSLFATDEQKEQWLKPLMDGEIRSTYIMTEPHVASSDASNITTRIERDGDDYVINGRKWWISGAGRDRCKLGILLGVTDDDADRHHRHSMVLLPMNAPGITILRDLSVMGYNPWESHTEVEFKDVRVPASSLLGEEGEGFAMAQARLGPGRIHHCMRMVGSAERALSLMIARAEDRTTFGTRIVDQGVIREWIAQSRIEIDQARLYTMYTAWLMDTVGNKAAASQISGIKVVVPSVATGVIDRAIQVFGGGGLCQDTPLAEMYATARILRLADGPDEVHVRGVARTEIKRQAGIREAGDIVRAPDFSKV